MPSQNEMLIESAKIIHALTPQNISGTAVTGLWVGVKDYRKVAVVIQTGAWAGGTSAVTLTQATDSSGTGEKSLDFDYYYASSTTSDSPVKTTVSSATYNLSAANKLHVIEVWAADLDVANGFGWLRLNLASPGSNADYVSASYVLYAGGYGAKPSTLPTVLS